MISDVQKEILLLKKEKSITILAHSYQAAEILEIADFVGDSYQLSVMAKSDPAPTCIVCGVHFMAETVKILSPNKRVILANGEAGCPMAEQFEPEFIEAFKAQSPDYTVVAYVNTTAALKAVCDVCVTSATAVKICNQVKSDNILFIPDCNLGAYVAGKLPQKHIELVAGGCPIHAAVTADEVVCARTLHPNALVLSHPECIPAVLEKSDFVGSTSAIMEYAKTSPAEEFIIGTEISIAENLAYALPDKKFHILSKKLICPDMKITTLTDVLHALKGEVPAIEISEEILKKASICIDAMIELGK